MFELVKNGVPPLAAESRSFPQFPAVSRSFPQFRHCRPAAGQFSGCSFSVSVIAPAFINCLFIAVRFS